MPTNKVLSNKGTRKRLLQGAAKSKTLLSNILINQAFHEFQKSNKVRNLYRPRLLNIMMVASCGSGGYIRQKALKALTVGLWMISPILTARPCMHKRRDIHPGNPGFCLLPNEKGLFRTVHGAITEGARIHKIHVHDNSRQGRNRQYHGKHGQSLQYDWNEANGR